MDITSANFKERLPEIEKAIETATFISIDGEFTGKNNYFLDNPSNLMVTTDHFPGLNVLKGVSSLDTPAERYTKIRDSAR